MNVHRGADTGFESYYVYFWKNYIEIRYQVIFSTSIQRDCADGEHEAAPEEAEPSAAVPGAGVS